MTAIPGTPEDFARHFPRLSGTDNPCRCEWAHKALGRLHGIDMGKGWVRMTTHPRCAHHGKASR